MLIKKTCISLIGVIVIFLASFAAKFVILRNFRKFRVHFGQKFQKVRRKNIWRLQKSSKMSLNVSCSIFKMIFQKSICRNILTIWFPSDFGPLKLKLRCLPFFISSNFVRQAQTLRFKELTHNFSKKLIMGDYNKIRVFTQIYETP